MTDHTQYGIHKYWLMNDGTVIYEDYVDEYIVENDDST